MRDNVEQHSTAPVASIGDDLCMMMDGIVARLKLRNDQMGRAVIYRYAWGISYSAIAKGLGVSKPRAESLVKSGEVWVDAVLDDRLAAA
jgi:DNA-directed RNA polymerase specialized sigma24 family protein